ncbi:MAG: type VII secretion protein EssB/YukC [Clostridium sp.]
MDVNKLEKIIKISDLNAKTDNEIKRISYSNVNLIPCEVEINGEDIRFLYDIEGLKPLDELKKGRDVEKFRFLINIYNVFKIIEEYCFDLNSQNLYYDYNFNVKIKDRDIRLKEEVIDIEDLTLQYKSLIGYIFDNNKYTYDNFYNGGMDLLKKNKKTEKYFKLETIENIHNELLSDLDYKEKEDREKYIEVRKRDFNINKYSIYAMGAAITILTCYTIYSSVFLIPFQKNVIKADNYYSEKNYEGVIKSLEKTRGMKLSKESKYKLAYSYIISESLSEDQKKNITLMLDSKSDENILDYWIAIGKSDYDEAIDLAKKVQDNELLLYSLLSKQRYIQHDTKMTGEEKESIQNELENQIEKINKELNGDNSGNKVNLQSSSEENTETENNESDMPMGLNLNPNN